MSWMEYGQSKNDNGGGNIKDLLQLADADYIPSTGPSEQGSAYNPYDYKDPSTKPKSVGDGGPLINDMPPGSSRYNVTRPSIFKEDGPLHEWAKARRIDWTADPTQQSPAISIDRKFASGDPVRKVISRYMLSLMPLECSIPMVESPIIMKTAASLLGIDSAFKSGAGDMYAKTRERANSVGGANWVNRSDTDSLSRGLYQFSVPSSSGKGDYDIYLQFLRTKNKRNTPNGFLDFDVQMSCSCDSFLWFGAQYYAVNGKYMYMPGFRSTLLAPHSRQETVSKTVMPDGDVRENKGKGLNFRMCKHLLRVMDFVKNNLTVKEVEVTKNFPLIGRPSKLVNTKRWEQLFKFPFTKDDIQKYLINTSNLNKRPNIYFTVYTPEQKHYDEVDKWVSDNFVDMSRSEKQSYFRFLAEHPEEIFYILWSYARNISPDKIDSSLVSSAYDYMSKTVIPESDEEPKSVVDESKKTEGEYEGKGMTGVIPPKDFPDKEELKEIQDESTDPQSLKEKRLERERKKEIEEENNQDKNDQVEDKTSPEKDDEGIEDKDRGVRKTDIKNEI